MEYWILDEVSGNQSVNSEESLSLRDELEAAIRVDQTPESPSSEHGGTTPDAKPDDRSRDDQGKFAKKDDKPADPTKKPDDAAKPNSQEADKPKETDAQNLVNEPPKSWNAEARDLFNKADPKLRDYIARRSIEQQEGVEKLKQTYEQKAGFADEMWSEIAPYAQLIQSKGGTPRAAIGDLLRTSAIFHTGTPVQRVQAIQQIADQFGIDLAQAAQFRAQPTDPTIQTLLQKVQQLEGTLSTQTQEQQESQNNALLAQVERFKADKPYFEDVRYLMGTLLDSGQAKDLQDAYDMAVYANPSIRSRVLAEQQATSSQRNVQAAQEQAAKAKSAAISVNGAPGMGSSSSGSAPAPNLRAELTRAFTGSGSRI